MIRALFTHPTTGKITYLTWGLVAVVVLSAGVVGGPFLLAADWLRRRT